MPNTYNNKVVLSDGTVLIDLTADSVTADKLAKNVTAHDKSGALITGTNTYDADTSDATAAAAEILTGKSAYVNGVKIDGSMPNRGSVSGTISTKAGEYVIPQGYHDGSGKVSILSTEQAKIVAENIRQGITILGVEGSMSGTEEVTAETRSVTPTFAQQIITPNTAQGYNYLAQVTVVAIPVAYSDNAAGGKTVTIG
ncbi:MAG: hypothetical protein II630_01700 [Bacteroidales bacterium]|nr:hypothetical protein [Bacteroidales bacterium]